MIFEVANGSYGYNSGKEVLQNICLRVAPGEVLSILGPNGVGKTTLLKCMMGLLRWKKGESTIDGVPLRQMPHREVWKKIAYVPQAKNSDFSFSALDMAVMGRNAHLGVFHQPGPEDYNLARQALRDIGVEQLEKKPCNEMSGGELQMVLIARALASQPDMLVLDEPESNLDFKNQLVILETLERLSREKSISCIFNTHYPGHALKISTNSLILTRGGKSIFGPAAEVISEENMRDAFSVNVYINDVTVEERTHVSVLALSIV